MCDPNPGLQCQAIEQLQSLLSSASGEVRWRVAQCHYDLTVPHEGKTTAVECKLVTDLVPLLTDSHPLVRTHTAGALMRYVVFMLTK